MLGVLYRGIAAIHCVRYRNRQTVCTLRTTIVGFCVVCTTGHTLTILLHREVCGSSGGVFVCEIMCYCRSTAQGSNLTNGKIHTSVLSMY